LDNAAAVERKLAREMPAHQFDSDNEEDNDKADKEEEDETNDGPDPAVDAIEEEPAAEPEKATPNMSRENIGVDMPLTRQELLDWLHSFGVKNDCQPDERFDGRVQFGMVGFPNVGKSSVINVLVGSSKHTHGLVRVAVASQPGKTKHFQTLLLPDRDDVMLCDCPGLVFPSFVSSTADLIAAGVFPIAQMRDHWPVTELICKRIPREILNAQYGIQLPIKKDLGNRDIVAPPTGEDLLNTYCYARSMLAASSGVPDFQRAARIIIKDYADGKLLYNHTPPTANAATFQRETIATALMRTRKLQEKFTPLLEMQQQLQISNDPGDDDEVEGDVVDGPEFDLDILEALEGMGTSEEKVNGGKRGKKHKSMQKWGKKGRKDRNKDPYGCHSNPDETLDGGGGSTAGVVVKAGKYTRKNYTRASHVGARAVAQPENRATVEKSAVRLP
jgi:large subunit GTPase 1